MGHAQQAMQLCCHAAAEINMHILLAKTVAMQLQRLTCIDYGPKQQAMQLCCHAAVEINKNA